MGALIGRDDDASEIEQALFDGHRLVTLTGPGGVGKTALAHVVEQRWVDSGASAWFVDCDRWSDPARLLDLIADSIGGGTGDSHEQIAALFIDGDGLLVLDNLEHLVDAGPAIAALVERDERIRIVVTSRVALRLRDEWVHRVEPLGTDALTMLADRIEAAGGERPASDDPLLEAICVLVDRLPLGIELAAARVPAFGLPALVEQLQHSVAGLQDSLRGKRDDHRSPLAAVASTHALLREPNASTLYRRLGAVGGTFGLDVALAMVPDADPVDAAKALAELVEFHLLMRLDDRPSYRMLVVVAEHARTLLTVANERAIADERLIQWAVATSLRPDPRDSEMTDDEHAAWVQRVSAGYPAIAVALDAARRLGRVDALIALVRHLRPFWISSGMLREGLAWAEYTARSVARNDPVYAELCFQAAAIADFAASSDQAKRWTDRGIPVAERSGDRYHLGRLLETAGVLDAAAGRLELAEGMIRRAVQEFRALELPGFIATCMTALADVVALRGDLDESEALYDQAVTLMLDLEMHRPANMARTYWADVSRRNGGAERALRLLDFAERGLANDAMLADYPLAFRALTYCDLGRFGDAAALATLLLDRSAGSPTIVSNATFAQARAAYGLRGSVDADPVHRSIDAFVSIENNSGLIGVLEWVAVVMPGGAGQANLVAAVNDLHRRNGSRRTGPLREVLGAESESPRGASVAEIHSWIDDALRATVGEPSPAKTTPSILSSRELAVLGLVTEGLTDRQIAERLFISIRTAQSHLAHILTKLRVNNRTAAVAAARSLGIISR